MRGSIQKRVGKKVTSYRIIYDVPVPETGQRKQVFETVEGGRKEAERILLERLAALDTGSPPNRSKLTVAHWLQSWLSEVVATRNRPLTITAYRIIVDRHIIPVIGGIALTKLQPKDVQRMQARVIEVGLSANTAKHVHVVLSKAIKDAMRRGLVHRNVCQLVDQPLVSRYKVDAPDHREIVRILEFAKQTPYYLAFHVAAYTGLRRGEIIALRWADIDLDNCLLSVTRTAQRQKGRGVMVMETKSDAGRRGVALDAETVAVIRNHKVVQIEHRLKIGGQYNDNDLLIPGPSGRLLDPAVLTRWFGKIATIAGAPHLRLHDLRHGHAAGLIKANVHAKIVQERLGHASAAFTMQVYGHVAAGLQTEAANAFALAMRAV